MPTTLHAVEYLAAPGKHAPRPVCVVFGDEPFLKRHVLERLRQAVLGDEGDLSYTVFDGRTCQWRDVLEELSTMAMFGGSRMALVDDADDFVSRYRPELEDYVAKPRTTGVLAICVGAWPSNTRLYKAVAASGLPVECTSPTGAPLTRWLSVWAQQTHKVQLSASAAESLSEMIGPELGLLDQELAKLALAAGPDAKITPEMVNQFVGSWRAKTTWEMLDAALAGNVREAIVELDRLFLAGEAPVALLAQISASLRRLAAATRLILGAESAGRRMGLRDALLQAGVKSFVAEKAERQLRRLGRERGGQLYHWLLEADLALKGSGDLSPRMVLERLILRLAVPSPVRAG